MKGSLNWWCLRKNDEDWGHERRVQRYKSDTEKRNICYTTTVFEDEKGIKLQKTTGLFHYFNFTIVIFPLVMGIGNFKLATQPTLLKLSGLA